MERAVYRKPYSRWVEVFAAAAILGPAAVLLLQNRSSTTAAMVVVVLSAYLVAVFCLRRTTRPIVAFEDGELCFREEMNLPPRTVRIAIADVAHVALRGLPRARTFAFHMRSGEIIEVKPLLRNRALEEEVVRFLEALFGAVVNFSGYPSRHRPEGG